MEILNPIIGVVFFWYLMWVMIKTFDDDDNKYNMIIHWIFIAVLMVVTMANTN